MNQNQSKPKIGMSVSARKGLTEDLPAIELVYQRCFPQEWPFGKIMEDGTPLKYIVLEANNDGIIGFAALSPDHHYRAHFAVLPSHRNHTMVLCDAMLNEMRSLGGNWWGKCRLTSYKFWLKRAAEGKIIIVSDEPGDNFNGEIMRRVCFRVV